MTLSKNNEDFTRPQSGTQEAVLILTYAAMILSIRATISALSLTDELAKGPSHDAHHSSRKNDRSISAVENQPGGPFIIVSLRCLAPTRQLSWGYDLTQRLFQQRQADYKNNIKTMRGARRYRWSRPAHTNESRKGTRRLDERNANDARTAGRTWGHGGFVHLPLRLSHNSRRRKASFGRKYREGSTPVTKALHVRI